MGADKYFERNVQNIMGRCVHFTGIQKGDLCKAGVAYVSVRDDSARPYRWPCIESGAKTTCPYRKCPTREQAEAEERQHEEALAAMQIGRAHV